MGELGGTVEYLYWSARRTGRFIEDNNLAASKVSWTLTSPALQFLPSLSRTATSAGNLRPRVAKTIERALGQIAVTRFNAPGPIKYAKGTSRLVFGEFKTWAVKPERQPAVMFTAVDYDRRDKGSVAVCLYGSMDNFPEHIQEAGPGFRDGWVSSSAPAVYNFIRSQGKQFDDPYYEAKDMAVEALRIADGQGLSGIFSGEHDPLGTDRAWQRGFTYGDVSSAQWLAQIYLDVDLLEDGDGREDGFRRVLIGAPLWIRTALPQAVELYASPSKAEVVEDRRVRAKWGMRAAEATTLRASEDRDAHNIQFAAAEVQEQEQEEEEQPESYSSGGQTIQLPYDIYAMLKAGFVKGEADWLLGMIDRNEEDRILNLGTPFGRVFAWVWNEDKDMAMIMLSDYLAELRTGFGLEIEIDPPIRLEEVLVALRPVLPTGFSDYDEVVTKARRDVRKYLGADPNK